MFAIPVMPVQNPVQNPLQFHNFVRQPPPPLLPPSASASTVQSKKAAYLQPKIAEIAGSFKTSLETLLQLSSPPEQQLRPIESRQLRLKRHLVQLSVQFRQFAKLLTYVLAFASNGYYFCCSGVRFMLHRFG
jgi:hypothetical protein